MWTSCVRCAPTAIGIDASEPDVYLVEMKLTAWRPLFQTHQF